MAGLGLDADVEVRWVLVWAGRWDRGCLEYRGVVRDEDEEEVVVVVEGEGEEGDLDLGRGLRRSRARRR